LFGQINFESLGVVPSLLPRIYVLIRMEQVYDECFKQLLRNKATINLDSSKAIMIAFGKGLSANQTQFWQLVCNFLYSISKFSEHKEVALFSEFIKLGSESNDFLLYLCLRQFFKLITLIDPAKEKDVAEIFISIENIHKIVDKAFWSDADEYDRVSGHLNSVFESAKHVFYYDFLEKVLEVDCQSTVSVMLSDLLSFYQVTSDKEIGYPRDHGNNIKRKNFVLKDFDLDQDEDSQPRRHSRSPFYKPVNSKVRNKIAKKSPSKVHAEEPVKQLKPVPMKRSVVSHPNLTNKREVSPITVRKIDDVYNKKYKRGIFETARALARKHKQDEQQLIDSTKTPEYHNTSKDDTANISEHQQADLDYQEAEILIDELEDQDQKVEDELQDDPNMRRNEDLNDFGDESEIRPDSNYWKREVIVSKDLMPSENFINTQEEKFETEKYPHQKNQFEMNLSFNSKNNNSRSQQPDESNVQPKSESQPDSEPFIEGQAEDEYINDDEIECRSADGLDKYQTYYKFKNKESLIGQSVAINKYSRHDYDIYEQIARENNLPEKYEYNESEDANEEKSRSLDDQNDHELSDTVAVKQDKAKNDMAIIHQQPVARNIQKSIDMSSEQESDPNEMSKDHIEYNLSKSSEIEEQLRSQIHHKIHSDTNLHNVMHSEEPVGNLLEDKADKEEVNDSYPTSEENENNNADEIIDDQALNSRHRGHSLYSQSNYTSCPNLNGGRFSEMSKDVKLDPGLLEKGYQTSSALREPTEKANITTQDKSRHITFASRVPAFPKEQTELPNDQANELSRIPLNEDSSGILAGDDLISPFMQNQNETSEFMPDQSFLKPVKFERYN